MSKYRMDEATAKMLAAELQSHRYWRVDSVYRDPDPREDGRWIVCLQHRYYTLGNFLLVTSEPSRELAENLNTWGRADMPRHLLISPNEVGIVKTQIPGHGGDCWWVEHRKDGGETTVAAYCFDEFEPYGSGTN